MTSVAVSAVVRAETWGDGFPVIVGWEHKAPCGCQALEGMRLDKPGPRDLVGEPVIDFEPCGPEHERLLDELQRGLCDNIPEPGRPLHDVVQERFAAVFE